MSSLKVHGVANRNEQYLLFGMMCKLPGGLSKEAVIKFDNSPVLDSTRTNRPYIEIRGSREMEIMDIIRIANKYIELIDVEAYDPKNGSFVFKPKGASFQPSDFAD